MLNIANPVRPRVRPGRKEYQSVWVKSHHAVSSGTWPAEPLVLRAVHDTHASLREALDEAVMCDGVDHRHSSAAVTLVGGCPVPEDARAVARPTHDIPCPAVTSVRANLPRMADLEKAVDSFEYQPWVTRWRWIVTSS